MRSSINITLIPMVRCCFALLVVASLTSVAGATVQILAWNGDSGGDAAASAQLSGDREPHANESTSDSGKAFKGGSTGTSDSSNTSGGGGGGNGGGGGGAGSANAASPSITDGEESNATPPASPIDHESANGNPAPGNENAAGPDAGTSGGNSPSSSQPPPGDGGAGPDLFDGNPGSLPDVVADIFHGTGTPPESAPPTHSDLPGTPAASAPPDLTYTPTTETVDSFSAPPETPEPLTAAGFSSAAAAPEPGTLLTVGFCLLLGCGFRRQRDLFA